MITIKVTKSGTDYRFHGLAVHYCGRMAMGTICETNSIRMALLGNGIAAAHSNLRAPGHWPCQTVVDDGAGFQAVAK